MTQSAHLPAKAPQFDSLRALIGDTPLVEFDCRLDGDPLTVLAKYELLNFTGSIKDRMGLRILDEAWSTGRLSEGDEIVEVTSGNTGIAFAALGRALGHPVRIYMPDWMSSERVQLIQRLGATIVPVSRNEGGFLGSVARADEYAKENERAFRPDQFSSEAGARAHRDGTGRELAEQARRAGFTPRAFVAGVGTGGTVMGAGAAMRAAFPGVTIHPLEPAGSPTLRTGKKIGDHRIQGISDEFVPALVHLDELDEIVDIDDGDAIRMAQRLSGELGFGVGISSGANLAGALSLAKEIGPGAVVATVFPDSNKKYLSTDLCREEPARDGHWTDRVEFRAVHVHPRLGAGEG